MMVARLVLAHGKLFFGVGAHVPLFFGSHARARVGAPSYPGLGVGGRTGRCWHRLRAIRVIREDPAQWKRCRGTEVAEDLVGPRYLLSCRRAERKELRLQVLLHFP